MFGRKAARIKVLEDVIHNFEEERMELLKEKWKLGDKNIELDKKVAMLEKELAAIKPVIENPDFKPAISAKCIECKLAARSTFTGQLLGCIKGLVCDDFERKDD